MHVRMKRALIGGLVGTAALTLMMYFVAPMMTGQKMDIAEKLGSMMGDSWAMGMAAHWFNGVVVFPIIYMLILRRRLIGPMVARGITWGVMLWFAAQLMVMPMVGMGVFSSNGGGVKSVMGSLIGHMIYGALLGVIAGPESAKN